MEELLQKTIVKIELNENNDQIVFLTDSGDGIKRIAYHVEGDCCSVSWIYSLSGVKNLLGQKVIEVIRKELPEPSESEQKGHDVLQDYGITLKTEKGYFDLVYRNESNGYYGGYLSCNTWSENFEGMREITEDQDHLV